MSHWKKRDSADKVVRKGLCHQDRRATIHVLRFHVHSGIALPIPEDRRYV